MYYNIRGGQYPGRRRSGRVVVEVLPGKDERLGEGERFLNFWGLRSFFNLLFARKSAHDPESLSFGKKKGFAMVTLICLLTLCLVGLLIVFNDSDEVRYMKNLYLFIRDATEWVGDLSKRPDKSDWTPMDERTFVRSEDPEQVRILFNKMGAYDLFSPMVISKNIELKVSPTTTRPGKKVTFEATPSPEIKGMPSRILLYGKPLDKTTSLSRRRDGKYRGSFTFKKTDSGVFEFFIATLPKFDVKQNAEISYGSNSVSVIVGPEKLSRIYFQEARPGQPMLIRENGPESPTIIAQGADGTKYDVSHPRLGAVYSIEDESKATIKEGILQGQFRTILQGKTPGRTVLKVVYNHLEAETDLVVLPDIKPADISPKLIPDTTPPPPPPPDIPYAINPPEGVIVHKGEKVVLEASSFDTSKGHTFLRSRWYVHKVNTATNKAGNEVADLSGGNSNIAEWYPRGTGTFEWIVYYSYAPFTQQEDGYQCVSPPSRIIVVE
jgi:hypothetical protein